MTTEAARWLEKLLCNSVLGNGGLALAVKQRALPALSCGVKTVLSFMSVSQVCFKFTFLTEDTKHVLIGRIKIGFSR